MSGWRGRGRGRRLGRELQGHTRSNGQPAPWHPANCSPSTCSPHTRPLTLSPITCWNYVTGIRVPRGSLSRAQDDYEAAATTCDNRRCLEALPYGARAVHWWVHNRAPRAITFPSDPGRPKAQCKASYHLLTSLQPSTCILQPTTATTLSKPSCAHGWVILMDGHFSSGWILKKCPL